MQIIETLRETIGDDRILTDQDMAPWTQDWMGLYRWTPLAVVCPQTTQEVSEVLRLTYGQGVPVVPVGGNTGITGATVADGAIMLSLHKLTRIEQIRPEARTAIVEAGVIIQELREAAAQKGLSFPVNFGAKGSARIGGILSTNAGGSNVVRYGNTRDLCLGLEVVLPDGRIMNLMSELHKDNSGFALKHLFIGAEGTLGIITRAVMKLVPAPRATATAMVAAADLASALSLFYRLQEQTGGLVEAFEYMPRCYIKRHLETFAQAREPFESDYEVNILLEIAATADRDSKTNEDGTVELTRFLETTLSDCLEAGFLLDAVVARSEQQRREMWARREAAAELFQDFVDSDVAVPLPQVAAFLQTVGARISDLDPQADILFVSHLGDGNIHYSIYPSRQDETVKDALKDVVEEVAVGLGGSFSAEHGVGLDKKTSMARRKDAVALDTMRKIKYALDPKGLMNPGKVLPD